MANTVNFKVGPLIGEHLLEIAQTNISNGNVEYGANIYKMAFAGFTDELTIKVLKNQLVVITDEDGEGIRLTDWENEIKANAHNIFDWESIIKKRHNNLRDLLQSLLDTEKEFQKFQKYYNGDIRNYSMLDMMKRYYNDEEMKTMSGTVNIAARICGDANCKVCSKGNSNPQSVWNMVEGRVERYLEDPEGYEYDIPAKWEIVLVLTVKYNKLIRMIHKEYMNYENTYLFLVEHDFIKKPLYNETFIENIISALVKFCDTGEGYYHPLCNEGLYEYKEKLSNDLMKTKFGKEFAQNGILKKDIMDGYDAGWLSPDGEFYGADGETSAMIHMNLAEQIFNAPCNIYAVRMAKDGVSIIGGIDSPEYWLEKHGWVKIHHNDCYGSFIGSRNKAPTPDFPYAYNPTDIQIKMICDYADKFYGGKFYTEANAFGRTSHPDPYTTYKVRQMDEFKIHEIFGR